MPQGISLRTNIELRKSLLTHRQRRGSRLLWPELAAKKPGPHIKTRTLRRQTDQAPRSFLSRKKPHLMSEDRARQLLRLRRRTERQNRRRGRHQARR